MKKLSIILLVFVVLCTLILGCNNKIKIEFETNGGSDIQTVVINKINDFKLPDSPQKEGYEFVGWYLDNEFTKEFQSLEKIEDLNKTIVLYAKWLEIHQHNYVDGFCECGDKIEYLIENNVLKKYYGSPYTLDIPEGVVCIDNDAFGDRMNSYIENITFPKSLQEIKPKAFNYLRTNNIIVEEGNEYFKVEDNNLVSIDGKKLYLCSTRSEQYTIPSTIETICSSVYSSLPKDIIINENVKTIESGALSFVKKLILNNTNYVIMNKVLYTKDMKRLIKFINGSDVKATYTEIIIPEMVESIDPYAYLNCRIVSLKMSDNVISIGEHAFDNTSITQLQLSKNIKHIENYTFSGNCLTSIILHEGIEKIGEGAFKNANSGSLANPYCNEIILPNSLSYLGPFAFSGKKTKEIIIPSNITEISEGAFYESKLEKVEFKGEITNIKHNAFSYCSFAELVIPDSVIEIEDYAFSFNENLTKLVLGKNVKIVEDKAFYYNDKLSDIYLNEGLEKVGIETFYMNNTTNIEIPNSIKYIGTAAFYNRESNEIYYNGTLSQWCQINKEYESGGFLSNENKVYMKDSNNEYYEIKNVVIPDKITSINDGLFCGFTYLETIDLSNDVIYIGNNAFERCSNLKQITIPENVSYIGKYAFSWCSSLESIEIPNGVSKILFSTFSCCLSLKNVVLPNSITAINNSAFSGCKSLISIEIPNSVTYIGDYAFSGCDKLQNINIPNSLDYIGVSPFGDCGSLKYNEYDNANYLGNESNPFLLLISAMDTNISDCEINPNTKFIHDYAFSNCKNLESIFIPSSVEIMNVYVFKSCETEILCEVNEKPEKWHENWNLDNTGEVHWSSKNN